MQCFLQQKQHNDSSDISRANHAAKPTFQTLACSFQTAHIQIAIADASRQKDFAAITAICRLTRRKFHRIREVHLLKQRPWSYVIPLLAPEPLYHIFHAFAQRAFRCSDCQIPLQRLACKDTLNNSVQEARVPQISQTSLQKLVTETRSATGLAAIVASPGPATTVLKLPKKNFPSPDVR